MFDKVDINELWKMTSYVAKCKFISSYLDSISIREYKRKGKRIESAKLIDLKLNSHKVNQLLDYENKEVIDKCLGKGVYKITTSEMKHEKDALEYIEILKKKYNFSVIEWEDDEDWFLIDSLFKIIKVNPPSLAKKKKIFGLYLKEDTAFNSQKLEVSLYS